MKDRLDREVVAMRAAKELPDGAYVNLGIGMPTMVSNYVPEGRTVIFQAESGLLNCGPIADEGPEDIDLINAGGQFLVPVPGMAFFHSADSFGMIRGGHIDVTILGGLQVSEKGDLANWFLPSRGIGGMGGAMDLVVGAKRVIVTMEHIDPKGQPKILKECTYPLTGKECVDLIVTDLAVIEVTTDGLMLLEVAPDWTPQEVQAQTEARLIVSPDVHEMTL